MDTKQTKTIGEHYVAAELARRGWAPAMTRDGLERSDILAVFTKEDDRRMIEVQVKTARVDGKRPASWPLGTKAQQASTSGREYFVLVAVPKVNKAAPDYFVVPRNHLAAAAWITHMAWLRAPDIPDGKRNVGVDRARVHSGVFDGYRNAWDLLHIDDFDAESRLPRNYEALASDPKIGLPPGHPWGRVHSLVGGPAEREIALGPSSARQSKV